MPCPQWGTCTPQTGVRQTSPAPHSVYIVGIFLCLPFPSRSPSSSGLDNIPGTSGEGVQEQTPSCGVFYERLAMVGRSLQNNSMHICRETGSFFRKSEGAERPPHAVS